MKARASASWARVGFGAGQKEDGGGGVAFAEGDEIVLNEALGLGVEVVYGGVEVLGVAGVEEPDGGWLLGFGARAEDAREPEGFGGEEGFALGGGGVVEDEFLRLGAVVAGGDGDGLAVAGFDELELALIEGFADGVEDERFGEGLLGGGDDLAEGDGHGGGDFCVEGGGGAVGEGWHPRE